MRRVFPLLVLVCLSACPKKRAELMRAVNVLQMQVDEKQMLLATASARGNLAGVQAMPMSVPEIPAPSMFEGSEEAKLRAQIAMLQAENARLDAMMKMLEAARADGGAR